MLPPFSASFSSPITAHDAPLCSAAMPIAESTLVAGFVGSMSSSGMWCGITPPVTLSMYALVTPSK